MKNLMLILLLLGLLSACDKASNRTITGYDLAQAGMLEEAEAEYKQTVLKAIKSRDKNAARAKSDLLQFYISTGQIQKADQYGSLAYIEDQNLHLGLRVADLLFNAGKYDRAYYHYSQAAILQARFPDMAKDGNSATLCNFDLISIYSKMKTSAERAKMDDEKESINFKANALLLDQEPCLSNKTAQSSRSLFQD